MARRRLSQQELNARPRCLCHSEPMYKHGDRWECREARRERDKAYNAANREQRRAYKKAHYNPEQKRAYNKAYTEANREQRLAYDKAYYEANRAKILARKKAYHEANREQIAEQHKAYREANQEKILEQKKAYREANGEKILARTKAYYEANREKLLARNKAYKDANREQYLNKRLQREYGSQADYDRMLEQQGGTCAVCLLPSKDRLHVDHDHLTHRVRGLLHPRCNSNLGWLEGWRLLWPFKAERYLNTKHDWRFTGTCDCKTQRCKELRYSYGLSCKERDALAEQQGQRCAICRQRKPLLVDHNHIRGDVRGLLCNGCNARLSMLDGQPWFLDSAFQYLGFRHLRLIDLCSTAPSIPVLQLWQAVGE